MEFDVTMESTDQKIAQSANDDQRKPWVKPELVILSTSSENIEGATGTALEGFTTPDS